MKREIKFRGKSIRSDEWCYGNLSIYEDEFNIAGYDIFREGEIPWVWEEENVDPDTVGQFTGLKDKNGKEIYEGDIVRMKEIGGYGSEYIGVVRYYEKDCRFGIDFTATDKFSKRGLFTEGEIQMNDGHCTITYTHEYEILGNVYDNPELLTEK